MVALALSGLLVASCIPVDAFLIGRLTSALIWCRLGWAACFLAIAWMMGRSRSRHDERLLGLLAIVVTYGFTVAIVLISGRAFDLYLHWVIIIPYALILLTRGDPLLSAANATTFALTAPWLLSELPDVSLTIAMASAGPMVAVLALIAGFFRRMRAAEEHLEHERQRVEEAERRNLLSHRMALVGRLAAGVAHEINNPLACVRSNVDQLRRRVREADSDLRDPEVAEMLEDTLEGVLRIQQTVASLKDFARGEPGEPGPCEVPPVVEDCLRLGTARLRELCPVAAEFPAEPVLAAASPR
ncbi:MAG: hypothetical protein HY901_38605, partial [Deltaproteobacteria bacterium]|nr:hypothetical protein [Deltaproteobacteria bacterium]